MRKSYNRWAVLFVGIFVIAANIQAEGRPNTFTLRSVADAATNQNPELRYYEAEIAKAKGSVLNAQSLNNPELAIDIGRKESSVSGASQGNGLAWEISYAQKFEYPGRIKLREAIAQKDLALAELQLNRFKLALISKAKSTALDFYESQQNREAAQDAADKIQTLVDLLSKREAAGPGLIIERKLIEGGAFSFKQRALQFSAEVEKLAVDLNTLTDIGINSQHKIAVPYIEKDFILPSKSLLEASALENNPDLIIKKAELSQQGLRVLLSENERKPSFTVRPFYSEENAVELERTVGLGFSVPLPIYNDNSGNIAIERAQVNQLEASLKSLEREIRGKIASLYATYKLQSEQVNGFSSKSITNLGEAVKDAEKQYKLGVVPASTYLQVQEQYLDNLLLHRSSQIQILKSILELEQVAGCEIIAEKNR